jgi:hypothetical protein
MVADAADIYDDTFRFFALNYSFERCYQTWASAGFLN